MEGSASTRSVSLNCRGYRGQRRAGSTRQL